MHARSTSWCLSLATAVALGSACGGAKQGLSPESALTAEQATLFADGVDLLEDPNALQDTWRSDWERETQRRVSESDRIVLGTVTTVRSQEDPGQSVSYYVVISVERTLAGPEAKHELVLTSREQAAGYGGLAEQRNRLLGLRVIAFIKYAKENEAVAPHFHLAIPSKPVFAAIDQHGKDPSHEVRVIEHTQK